MNSDNWTWPQGHRGLTVMSIGPYNWPPLREWVKALKGGDKTNDFSLIAKKWTQVRQLRRDIALKYPVIIVPAPPKTDREIDHATSLARALSTETGWDLDYALKYRTPENSSQKTKRVHQRMKRVFSSTNQYSHFRGTILFIDDVVASGSTAFAAFEALGKPHYFEVWCLAYQPKLALTSSS